MKRRWILLLTALIAALALSLAGCESLLGGLVNIEGGEYETEQLKPKDEVKAALGNNYEITVKYGMTTVENGTPSEDDWTTMSTTKVAGDYTFTRIINLGEEEPTPEYHLSGKGLVYTYDTESGKYTAATAATETYYGGYAYVMEYVGDSLDYNTKEAATFLGRACTKYTRDTSMTILGNTVAGSYVYYIDDATGICLKYEMSGGMSSQTEGTSSGSLSYTVTELKLSGADVSDQIAKIALIEWPTEELFTAFGLAEVTKPEGTYKGGSVTFGESDEIVGLKTIFTVTNSDAASQICQGLFAAGANLDKEEAVAEVADLLTSDSSYLTFTGYTSTGYKVNAVGYSNGDSFDVTLTFSK